MESRTNSLPFKVYLDSSDFSTLSSRQLNEENRQTLEQLISWVEGSKIICFFSGTHLSEMAPLDSDHHDAAERRADLVVKLCRRNAMISIDRLFAQELSHAIDDRPINPFSSEGQWYPDGVEDCLPDVDTQLTDALNESIAELKGNRQEKRRAKRLLMKKGQPRKAVLEATKANAAAGPLDQILEKYPMRPSDARVLSRYIAGLVSREEASMAFIESLRDPSWMMRWFGKAHDQMNPFIQMIRGPAAEILESANKMAELAVLLRQPESVGSDMARLLLSAPHWKEEQDRILLNIARRISKVLAGIEGIDLSIERLDDCCPGFTTCVRSSLDVIRHTTSETPRKGKLSDFPDSLHAAYAPYVDFFRADAFMSGHVKKLTKNHSVQVIPKLKELVPAIQQKIDANRTALDE